MAAPRIGRAAIMAVPVNDAEKIDAIQRDIEPAREGVVRLGKTIFPGRNIATIQILQRGVDLSRDPVIAREPWQDSEVGRRRRRDC